MADIFQSAIATVAEQSADFRRVLWTDKYTQLVIMTIPPGGELGEETHGDTDQILTFVTGIGEADVAGRTTSEGQGDLVTVPAGTRHNFRNTGVNPGALHGLRTARTCRRYGSHDQRGRRRRREVRPGPAATELIRVRG